MSEMLQCSLSLSPRSLSDVYSKEMGGELVDDTWHDTFRRSCRQDRSLGGFRSIVSSHLNGFAAAGQTVTRCLQG